MILYKHGTWLPGPLREHEDLERSQHTNQRLSAQKCEAFKKFGLAEFTLIPLTINPRPIRFEAYNCSDVVQLTVGGEQARHGEFPHHAMLGYRKEGGKSWDYDFLCGGTLISEQHVLTAAHCLEEGDPDIVRLGEYDTESNSMEEHDSDIDSIRVHPSYRISRLYHDIALIKLKYPVIISKHIRPACLWESEQRNATQYVATGFESNETFGTTRSTVMRKAQLREIPAGVCVQNFKGDRRFKKGLSGGQLCIGSTGEPRNNCLGDSGGSLVVLSYEKYCSYFTIGIKSREGFCGVGDSPAIYTKVSYYIDWIEDNAWGANAM